MEQALSLRQVAERLKLPHYRIEYAYSTHRIPEPLRVSNRRVFQHADVERIAKHFQVPNPTVASSDPSPVTSHASETQA